MGHFSILGWSLKLALGIPLYSEMGNIMETIHYKVTLFMLRSQVQLDIITVSQCNALYGLFLMDFNRVVPDLLKGGGQGFFDYW